LKKIIKKGFYFLLNNKNTTHNVEPVEVFEFKKSLAKKQQEGFDFHQNVYKNDAVVRDWVHREDFLDYKLPT